MNYVEYYDRYEVLKDKEFVNNLSIFDGIFMGGLALFHLLASLGCLSLFFSQIYATISEHTFYERSKNHNVESQFCLITSDNLKKDVISYLFKQFIY
jgi:hypothetical protein